MNLSASLVMVRMDAVQAEKLTYMPTEDACAALMVS
jgi:hypothetical protein